jgi:hypothetical protein
MYHIGVGYDDKLAIFHLRRISTAEETRYTSRFLTIPANATEEQRAEKEFAIYVDALADWSEQPVSTKDDKGVELPMFPEAETPAQSVRDYFNEQTVDNERIATSLIIRYRTALAPNIVFF